MNLIIFSLNHSLLSFGYESIITFQILKQMILVLAKILQTYKHSEGDIGEESRASFCEQEQSYQVLSVRDYQLVVKILSVVIIYSSTLRPVVLALYRYR